MNRKVLMIANDFPPIGGAGVQRSVYFAKYLPAAGWDPVVLTVRDVVFPAKDPSLLDELPADVEILRTGSLELRRLAWLARRDPKEERDAGEADSASVDPWLRELGRGLKRWLFVPDDRMMWAPFAVLEALRQLRRRDIELVYATVPSYSAGVIGCLVSRLTGLPFVLDLRDPWTRDPYLPSPTRLHGWINARLEALAVRRADHVVLISPTMRTAFDLAYPDVPGQRFHVITNGYDAERMQAVSPIEAADEFVVAYVGSLYAHHEKALEVFLDGWEEAALADDEFAGRARLWLVGRCDPEIEALVASRRMISSRLFGYRPHEEGLGRLKGAHALLLLIQDLDPTSDLITIPGKLFEYMAGGSPIVMIGPEGDAADIVRSDGGQVFPHNDADGIAAHLRRLFRRWATGTADRTGTPEPAFDRRRLAARLAELFDDAVAERA